MNRASLRSHVRAARDVPIFGAVVRAADRFWWQRIIRRSGLIDAEFYAAQLGLSRIRVDAAVWHYVVRGFRRGLSLNPLFDEIFAGGGLPEVFRVPALYAYLVGERATIPVHPWWDAVAMAGSDGTAGLERVWNDPSAEVLLRVGSARTSMSVAAIRQKAIDAARAWSCSRRRAQGDDALLQRPETAVAVIRLVQARDRRYHLKLAQAADLVASTRASVNIAMIDPSASQWISSALFAAVEPRVSVRLHSIRATWSGVLTDEISRSGDPRTLVVLDSRAEFSDSEIDELAAAGRSSLAIPAHRFSDGTLYGLGAAQVGDGRPYRILCEHPHEDAAVIPERVLEVPLATGRTFAVNVAEYHRCGGMGSAGNDELEVVSRRLASNGVRSRVLLDILPVLEEPELTFRRGRVRPVGATAVAADRARAEDVLSAAGFDVRGWRLHPVERPVPVLTWRRPAPHAQRWAIKVCSPAGRAGAVWGDTHFARGLASALERRGHYVVIDAYDARDRDTGYLDDVSVVVRGPYRIDAPRWGVSLQWIISHPEQITRGEAAGFDRVFAASVGWSQRTGARWGIRIDPLLEATDTDLFRPTGRPRGSDIVFVGTARGIPRPSVVTPLAAGIPVRVYGPDWRPFIPHAAIAAQSIANDELPARYETASVVLNDQWPTMRREGFIAMRPFDAVAVGSRVISEPVDGIEKIFEGAVVVYRDPAHLVELLRADPAGLFPSDEEMAEISERVRRNHSFDARAAVLEEAASEAVRERR